MDSPGWTIDVDDSGMMDHAIDDGGCDDGIAGGIAEGFEVDVCGYQGGCFAVTGVDDFEEQGGVS